jgi:hypothetical protein
MQNKSIKTIDRLLKTVEKKAEDDAAYIASLKKERAKRLEENEIKKRSKTAVYPLLNKAMLVLADMLADQSRTMVNCVAIYEDAIYATDSYKAIRIRITDEEKKLYSQFPLSSSLSKLITKAPKYPILVPRKILKDSLEKINNSTSLEILNNAKILKNDDDVMIITTELDKEVIHKARNVEGEYPREGIDKLFPRDNEIPIAKVSFDLEYLNQLVKALSVGEELNKGSATIRIYKCNGKEDRPVVVSTGQDHRNSTISKAKRIGLLMPLRL